MIEDTETIELYDDSTVVSYRGMAHNRIGPAYIRSFEENRFSYFLYGYAMMDRNSREWVFDKELSKQEIDNLVIFRYRTGITSKIWSSPKWKNLRKNP